MPTSNRSKKSKKTQNALQKGVAESEAALMGVYPELIDEIVNKTTWNEVNKEVKKIFKDTDYAEQIEDITLNGNLYSTNLGLGGVLAISSVEDISDYYLHTTYDGATLSSRLSGNVKDAEELVSNVIKEQLEFKTNWKALSKEIGKARNTVGDVSKVITDLEEAGQRFIKGKLSPSEIRDFNKKVKKAQGYVSKLSEGNAPTKGLKKAYQGVIDAVNKNDSKLLKSALDKAFSEKIQYNNARVSRTEMTRAYSLSFHRRIEEDDLVIGYRFLLSPEHPKPDQCDLCAEVDNGGGKGVYKKGDNPTVPVHPHCLCMLEEYVDRGQKLPKEYTDANAKKYLNSIDEKKRGQIIGVNNAKTKGSWQEGLEKKQVAKDSWKKRTLLPKKLVEEVE